jgi:hypothetical protein
MSAIDDNRRIRTANGKFWRRDAANCTDWPRGVQTDAGWSVAEYGENVNGC